MKSVLDQAQAAVVYALQLAALAVLEVLVASCVWMGAMSTALLWQLVLGAWRAMRWAEVCRCVLVAAAVALAAAVLAAAACRCAVVAATWPMVAMWLSHRRTRRDAAAVAEACRSCRAHRPVAAAAVCLYAVVAAVLPAAVLAAMCACMSVRAAAVRAAICA